jgi:hypothetical protein
MRMRSDCDTNEKRLGVIAMRSRCDHDAITWRCDAFAMLLRCFCDAFAKRSRCDCNVIAMAKQLVLDCITIASRLLRDCYAIATRLLCDRKTGDQFQFYYKALLDNCDAIAMRWRCVLISDCNANEKRLRCE